MCKTNYIYKNSIYLFYYFWLESNQRSFKFDHWLHVLNLCKTCIFNILIPVRSVKYLRQDSFTTRWVECRNRVVHVSVLYNVVSRVLSCNIIKCSKTAWKIRTNIYWYYTKSLTHKVGIIWKPLWKSLSLYELPARRLAEPIKSYSAGTKSLHKYRVNSASEDRLACLILFQWCDWSRIIM